MSIVEENSGYTQTRLSEIPNSVTEERFKEFERQVVKPRLGHYKALLSFDNPDLEIIINAFIYCARVLGMF